MIGANSGLINSIQRLLFNKFQEVNLGRLLSSFKALVGLLFLLFMKD